LGSLRERAGSGFRAADRLVGFAARTGWERVSFAGWLVGVRCANGLGAGFVRRLAVAVSASPLPATDKGAPVAAPP